MTAFLIAYFFVLIGASCVAAYYKSSTAPVPAVRPDLRVACGRSSGRLGPAGDDHRHRRVVRRRGGPGLQLQETLILTLPREGAKLMRTAPLTAAFGMLVIIVYIIAAVFAPVIAPFGESEIVGSAFALPDDQMILGGDQLGRDMFSRLIYGARNTVGIALGHHGHRLLTVGVVAGLTGGLRRAAGSIRSWAGSSIC